MTNDLISRSAAKELRDQVIRGERPDIKSESDLLDAVPTVDAVPVVRCKNCRYSRDGYTCHRKAKKGGQVDRVSPNFFCAAGKRRDDG